VATLSTTHILLDAFAVFHPLAAKVVPVSKPPSPVGESAVAVPSEALEVRFTVLPGHTEVADTLAAALTVDPTFTTTEAVLLHPLPVSVTV
jgi:hypothetical protein